MSDWKAKSRILVTCPRGISPYLREEISALNFPVLAEWDTAIQTEGTLQDTMLLNLHLRTAQRVLYQLETLMVHTPESLYRKINAIPWENILHASGRAAYVCVTSLADNPLITDSRFVNVKVKDAIVDRLRDQCGSRPDSGPDRDKAVIHVYWKNNRADVYLDTSGERLSLRGYRKIPLFAPMQETLAAAVIMATGWRGNTNFINPMCGSGTLAIEAALIALNRAPGLLRNRYGFMFIKEFPEADWNHLRKQAKANALKGLESKIVATDIDPKAVDAARQNAQTAGVDHWIAFHACPYNKTLIPEGNGIIMLNPPYGERMQASSERPVTKRFHQGEKVFSGDRKFVLRKSPGMDGGNKRIKEQESKKLETIYEGIGNFFKKTGNGYSGYIFTGNMEMIKKVGLRTQKRMTFFNGEIECRLLEYKLYAGSLKHKTGTVRAPEEIP
jgi:putative N6-adenine-specific DNA methylase